MPPFSQNFITFQKIKNINHYSSKRHVQARAKHIVFGHFSSRFFAHFFAVFMPGQKKTQPGSHILRLPGKRHLRMAFQKHVFKCTF